MLNSSSPCTQKDKTPIPHHRPAKLPKIKTDEERALAGVTSLESLEVIGGYVCLAYNALEILQSSLPLEGQSTSAAFIWELGA